MDRRSFVTATGLTAGLAAAATLSPAGVLARARDPVGDPSTKAVSAWRDVFDGMQADYDPVTVRFEGRLPQALRGTLYRNGPGLSRRGPTRYRHWFDGDGLVHAFTIGDGRLRHHARSVRTARFDAEAAAGQYLWDGFGTRFPGSRPVSRPDDMNPANIALLDMGDELLALWEGGSPYRVDPQTLATRGRKVYSDDTDGMPFTAHPRVDRDGTVWSFGYAAGSGKLALYRIDRSGRLVRSAILDAPNADMIHDFAITERFLVFVLMPLGVGEPDSAQSLLERYRLHADRPTVVLAIDKDTFEIRHRAELPAMTHFHLGNAWEDGRSLRIQVMRVGNFQGLMNAMYASFEGKPATAPRSADDGAIEIVLDRDRNTARVETMLPEVCDFPAFDRRRQGIATDVLFSLRASGSLPPGVFGLNELVAIDRARQRVEAFDYGRHRIAEEHLFVPAPGSDRGQGWLVGTAYDWSRRRTLLSVFDAKAVSAGPIAQAELPRALAPGLHGVFRTT